MSWVADRRDALGWGGRVLAVVGSLGVGSCSAMPGFGCTDDSQCRHGERQGHCEPIGFCAYPDSDCPSGSRYSQYAGPPYKKECTPEPVMGTTTSEETESSGSSGDPDPVCGNGIVEDGEQCDEPGLPTSTCNRCCRRRGVWRDGDEGEGIQPAKNDFEANEGYDLLLLEDGDFVIAGTHEVESTGWDALVIRVSATGDLRWWRSFYGAPYVPDDPEEEPPAHAFRDEARSLALAPGGNSVLVGGFLVPGTGGTSRSAMWLAELDVATGATNWQHVEGEPLEQDRVRQAAYDLAEGLVLAGEEGWAPRGFAARRYALIDGLEPSLEKTWAYDYYDEPEPDAEGMTPPSGNSIAHAVLVSDDLVFAAGTAAVENATGRYLRALELGTGEPARDACSDPGNSAGDGIHALAASLEGHIAVAGFRGGAVANREAWVALYGPRGCNQQNQGNPIWQRFALTGKEARGLAVDAEGNLYVTGFADGSGRDIWVAKYLHMGNLAWEETHNGPYSGNDEGWGLVLDEDACEVAVVGTVESSEGHNDIWMNWLGQ